MLGQFTNRLGGVVFGPGGGAGESEDSTVESLLQRVSDGVLAEDRREAMEKLRDLLLNSAKAQAAVGAMGFPILCEVIREERQDLDMLRTALECLTNAFTSSPTSVQSQQESQIVGVNAELFSRDRTNVPLLLRLLEEEPEGVNDFHVRYHALQVLTGLASAPHRLQEAVLGYPMGVVRLMDMTLEREVIRNEALLLMIVLAHENQEIQKIAAFEGAFDRLLDIIKSEGGADGGVVVQDCLQLLQSLLRRNASNQRMFREVGHVAVLPGCLRLRQHGGTLGRQQVSNLLYALETIRVLLGGGASMQSNSSPTVDGEAGQNAEAVLKSGIDDILIGAPLGDQAVSSAAIRTQALVCLAALVSLSPEAKAKLRAASCLLDGSATSVVVILAKTALGGPLHLEQQAAEAVLQAYCINNPSGQTELLSSLQSGGPFGQLIQTGLGSESISTASTAARLMTHLLSGNASAKASATSLKLRNGDVDLFMAVVEQSASCTSSHKGTALPGAAAAAETCFCGLLLMWCHDSESTAAALARCGSPLESLAASVRGSSNGSSSSGGLAAAALVAAVASVSSGTQEDTHPAVLPSLLSIIEAAGGAAAVAAAIQEALSSPAIAAALSPLQPLRPVTRQLLASALEVDSGNGGAVRQSDYQGTHSERRLVWFPQDDGRYLATIAPLVKSAAEFASAHLADLMRGDLKSQDVKGALGAIPQFPRQQHHQYNNQHQHQHFQQQQGVETPSFSTASGTAGNGNPSTGVPKQLAQDGHPQQQQLQFQQQPSAGGLPSTTQMSDRSDSVADNAALQAALRRAADAEMSDRSDSVADNAALQAALRRAADAENLTDTVRQQLAEATGERTRLRQQLTAAAADVKSAQAAQAKAEADTEDLAAALEALESHAAQLESQLREACSATFAASQFTGETSTKQDEVKQAVAAALEAAQEESEETLGDLLACLGQEERKTLRLSDRLTVLGEDVEALLADIAEEPSDEET